MWLPVADKGLKYDRIDPGCFYEAFGRRKRFKSFQEHCIVIILQLEQFRIISLRLETPLLLNYCRDSAERP